MGPILIMKRAAIQNFVKNQTHMVTIVSDIDGQSQTYAYSNFPVQYRI